MKRIAASVAFAFAAGCSGADSGCGDVQQWLTEPADLAVAGGYAFAAVAWHPLDAGCFDSTTRIHAIELGASPGARASRRVNGSLLGEGVATAGAVFFASGADEAIFAIDAQPPFDVDRIALPGVPTTGAAAGGRAFFPLFSRDSVWSQPESGDGEEISVTAPVGVVESGGRVYVPSADGFVAEIDAASSAVLREIPACAPSGPITLASGGTLVLACDGGGAGVLDIATGAFDTVGGALTVAALSGGATAESVLWSVDGAADRYTQVLAPASGGIGEQLSGWLTDAAVFAGAHAFASLDGTPWRIALSGSGSAILTGFASDAGARVTAGDPGEILVLEGGSGSGARLHRRDTATGAPVAAPIPL